MIDVKDQQAAKEWEQSQSEEWFENTPMNETYHKAFLAGCAHVRAELEPEIERLTERVILREQEIVERLLANKIIKYY